MNLYRKFEDKWVYKHYNSVKDDEYFLFSIDGSEGESTMSSIRMSIRGMAVSLLFTILLLYALSIMWLFTAWLFFMFYFFKSGLEGKMSSGYPYMEHTDVIGLWIVGMFSFIPIVILIMIFI